MAREVDTESLADRVDGTLKLGIFECRDVPGLLVDEMVVMPTEPSDLKPRDAVLTVNPMDQRPKPDSSSSARYTDAVEPLPWALSASSSSCAVIRHWPSLARCSMTAAPAAPVRRPASAIRP